MQHLDFLPHDKLLDLADVISHLLSLSINYNVLPYREHAQYYSDFLDICDLLDKEPISFMDSLAKSRSDKQRPE